MARTPVPRLIDIRAAIAGINQVIGDHIFEAFGQNWGAQRAVERGLEIISEASRNISDDYKSLAPEIPWRQIAAIGNLLRHEYQSVDSQIVWNIVIEHLPKLAIAIDRLITAAQERDGT